MICDECGKNEAHIHIVQIGPNGKFERNLCEECAAQYGTDLMNADAGDFSLANFLKDMIPTKKTEEDVAELTEFVCPQCGMSYRTFTETGRLGCAACYDAFRSRLIPLLRRVQGASEHHGKIPHRGGSDMALRAKINALQDKLKDCIQKEAYEKAAEYRDCIRMLEKGLQKEKLNDES